MHSSHVKSKTVFTANLDFIKKLYWFVRVQSGQDSKLFSMKFKKKYINRIREGFRIKVRILIFLFKIMNSIRSRYLDV